MTDYVERYLNEASNVLAELDRQTIVNMLNILKQIKSNEGRLFFLGVGGGAANSSHAVNDFRKISGIESYAATDNVGELTARINDDGWDSCFENWLAGSKINNKDGIFVFSVGGGSEHTSANIVRAVDYARSQGTKIMGVVSRDGGHTGRMADACLIVPPQSDDTITPLAESFQAVVWHLLATGLDKAE